MSSERRAYLGLGSNEGDRAARLQGAVDGLAAVAGITVAAVSPVYETDPVGGPPQGEYLNAVVAIETTLSPRELLAVAKRLEADAGRDPDGERWGPRPLDVDILLVGNELVNEPDLVVPHARLFERHFVLAPLGDLDPDLVAMPRSGWRGVRRTALTLLPPSTP
ncbi:MAG TPA: 2-amino-4-hydroxy-6-hydroxymethyldihydropteridine diphosphokinase [Acidimicrobiia bacterium]